MSLLTNLSSYWTLDEATGNYADSAGSNTLTRVGSAASAGGILGNAASLTSGSSQGAEASSGTPLDFTTGDFTVQAWFKTSTSQSAVIAGKGLPSPNRGWQLFQNGGQVLWRAYDASSLPTSNSNSSSLNNGAWHHLVGVCDRSGTDKLLLYVDGVLQTSQTSLSGIGSLTNTTAFGLGYTTFNNTNFYTGLIDESAVWSRALSGTEVTQLFNSGSALAFSKFVPAYRRRTLGNPRIGSRGVTV